MAAAKPPGGTGVTEPSWQTLAALAIAQVPAMPRDKVPRGTPAPRATAGCAGPLPAARGDTRAPSAPSGPSRCSWFPAASPGLDGSPKAVPEEGEGWVPRASPHCQQVPVLSGEAAVALGPGLLCGCWCPAGGVAARGHGSTVGCMGMLKALGVLGVLVLPLTPPCLAMSQMCFGAEPCPVPPSSWESPMLQHPLHLDDRDSEQASPAHPRHVPGMSPACPGRSADAHPRPQLTCMGREMQAMRRTSASSPAPWGWPVLPWQLPTAMTPRPPWGGGSCGAVAHSHPHPGPRQHGCCSLRLAPLPTSSEPAKRSRQHWGRSGIVPQRPTRCPQPRFRDRPPGPGRSRAGGTQAAGQPGWCSQMPTVGAGQEEGAWQGIAHLAGAMLPLHLLLAGLVWEGAAPVAQRPPSTEDQSSFPGSIPAPRHRDGWAWGQPWGNCTSPWQRSQSSCGSAPSWQ